MITFKKSKTYYIVGGIKSHKRRLLKKFKTAGLFAVKLK